MEFRKNAPQHEFRKCQKEGAVSHFGGIVFICQRKNEECPMKRECNGTFVCKTPLKNGIHKEEKR